MAHIYHGLVHQEGQPKERSPTSSTAYTLQGEVVEENKPKRLPYVQHPPCSTGLPSKIKTMVHVHSDVHDSGAPELKTGEC